MQVVSINVSPSSKLQYSYTQGNGCGASTGYKFDSGEHVTVMFGTTTQNLFSGNASTGTVDAQGSGCYYNNGSSEITVVFSGGGNRIDEAYELSYELNSGDNTCSLLPINLVQFSVNESRFSILISFSTSSETNNDYFTIERSADGRDFDAIGMIDGAGNSNIEINYEFTDEKPLPGINYYRIKQTDFDGKYSYSDIRSVRFGGFGGIQVSPRTTDGRLTITTTLEDYTITIINTAGQPIKRIAALSLDQNINIDDLHTGLYFVRVSSGSEAETIKVIKI